MSLKDNNLVIGIITTIVIIIIITLGIYMQYTISNNKQEKLAKETKETKSQNKEEKVTEKEKEDTILQNIDYKEIVKEQMAEPKKGETIAKIHVKNFGEIDVKFFKEDAPKAVENFLTHAKNGYYNGVTFHRVINDFMIQGGDPKGDGTGGESIWGEPFEKEVNVKRFPFRGTIAMASTSLPKSLGSQFFITQAKSDQNVANQLKLRGVPNNLLEAYKEFGGYPSLFMNYTVFGQVYKGMDIVDKIAAVKVNAQDKPEENVVIEKVEVEEVK